MIQRQYPARCAGRIREEAVVVAATATAASFTRMRFWRLCLVEANFKILLLVWLGCAAIVPFLADVKGRHAGLWFLFALTFGPFVLLTLIVLRRNQTSYTDLNLGCSTCVQAIESGETSCSACNQEFDLKQIDLAEVKMKLERSMGNVIASFLFGFLALIFVGGSYLLPSFVN